MFRAYYARLVCKLYYRQMCYFTSCPFGSAREKVKQIRANERKTTIDYLYKDKISK